MPLSVRCPKCKTVHRVAEKMAGQRAKCRCGAVMAIPQPQQAQPSAQPAAQQDTVVVQCPACGKRHKAKASMAGTAARCPCGATMQIPDPQQPAAPAAGPPQSTIWDELNDDQWAKIEGRQTAGEIAMEEQEAMAADEALHSGKGASGLWRDGKRLICSRNAKFPARCVKSNEPTNNRVLKKFSYCPPWALIIFGALIAIAFTRKMDIEYTVEPRFVKRRMIHALVGVGVAVLGVLFIFIGVALADGGGPEAVGVVVLLMGVVSAFVGLIYSAIGGRVLSVAYIDDVKEHAWLKGACPEFLDSLPMWNGPRH